VSVITSQRPEFGPVLVLIEVWSPIEEVMVVSKADIGFFA
jgi:hypothetical protein